MLIKFSYNILHFLQFYETFFRYGFYLKPIAIFSALLTLDFLMEIRVEYLWSCWLLIKSVTDSYKYQGLVRRFKNKIC